MLPARAWRVTKTGLALRVRLTPRSSRDAIEGLEETAEGPAIKARVRAVPEAGKANASLEKLVADWLGVARQSVAVSSGGKSRVKTLSLDGDANALAVLVDARLDAASSD